MVTIVCPVDGKDDVIQKVSAVVASGSGTAPYRDYDGYTFYHNVQSNLAQLLSAPAEPKKPGLDPIIWIIACISIWGILPAFLIHQKLKSDGRPKYEAEMAGWAKAKEVWGRLYYCWRHDFVFDPETGKGVSSHEMNQLIPTYLDQSMPSPPMS